MTLSNLRKIFSPEGISSLIEKCMFIVRLILIICSLFAAISLLMILFTDGKITYFPKNILEGITLIILMTTFYSMIFGTIPSMIFLIAIWIGKKLGIHYFLQPIKTAIKLLLTNIIIILIDVGLVALYNYNIWQINS